MKTEDYFKNNQMAVDIFNAKYAFEKENGEKENVLEVFTRVARNLAVYESEPEKWEKIWIDDMMEGWYRPGGSILSGVGSKSVISLANCFSADTQFITERGTKCFSDFKDGDKVKVLTRYGSYKQGTIRKHGEQEIVFLTLRQNSIKKTIKTTADHLWFTGSDNFVEKETRYLIARQNEKADSIPVSRKRLMTGIENSLDNIGIIHGMVYGDGSLNKTTDRANIELFGEKTELSKYFDGFGYVHKETTRESIRFGNLPKFLKELPDFEKHDFLYIISFFVGYFSVDGSCSAGKCCISSTKHNEIKLLSDVLQSVGIYGTLKKKEAISNLTNKPHNTTNYYIKKSSMKDWMFLRKKHKEDFLNNSPKKNPRRDVWFVDKIEFTGKTEMVWCINEPETNSFVLEDGILTHNCTTIPLSEDSIQGINKCVSDMMLCAAKRQGLGVDVSVLRPKGAKVNNAANESTGAIPWMDYLQSMGNYVGQAGRRPAVLLSIKCNHPDVIEFIKSKTDLNLIQNANISVQITDAFMEAVIEDNEWELHFETKHEIISKIVRAKDIFGLISESAHVSAEPGVQFIDLMRKGSMIHQIYLAIGDKRFYVVSTNACVTGSSFVHVRINGSPQVMLVKDVVSLFKNGSDLVEIFSFDHETGMDSWSQITFAGLTRKNAELIQIEDDETGFKITCTPDHKIFTLNRGYVRADQLNENDQIKTI